MQPIILKVVVDEKRRIMIDLPDEMPLGEVELQLTVYAQPDSEVIEYGSREWVQIRLREVGLLAEYDHDFANADELSDEEEVRLSHRLAGEDSTLDLINKDREERF